MKSDSDDYAYTFTPSTGAHARSTLRNRLVGDEVGEKVSQDSEQRQATNAVGGQNPGATAFMMFD